MSLPPSPQKELETLSGQVERVTFHSEESGFCVLRVKVRGRDELVTVVGFNASAMAGEHIEAGGQWVNDREYGLQFRTQSLRSIPPSTLEGMEKYLGSGLIKGIGPYFAEKLVKAFGEGVFETIENKPQHLLSVEGIGKGRLSKIVRGWQEQKSVRQIMVFLQSHGMGTMRAVRIYKTYGEQSIDRVRENPYRLAADIRGIGFRTADQLAQRLGIDPQSLIRARAGIHHVLLELSGDGHCGFPTRELLDEAVRLLEIPADTILEAIDLEIAEGKLVREEDDGETWLYLTALYQSEVSLAQTLRRLAEGTHLLPSIDLEKAITWV